MTRAEIIAALGALTTQFAAKPTLNGKHKKFDASGTYDMLICQAGKPEALIAQGSLTYIASQIALLPSTFSCAALLIVNLAYHTQLEPSESAFIAAVGDLTPGNDTSTYNISTWDPGQKSSIVGQGDIATISNIVTSDAGNLSFSCAAIVCINTGYQTNLNTAENNLIQAIGNL